MSVDSFAAESITIFKRESLLVLRQNTRRHLIIFISQLELFLLIGYSLNVTACIFQYLRKVISLSRR
jgi:hypothetical protein